MCDYLVSTLQYTSTGLFNRVLPYSDQRTKRYDKNIICRCPQTYFMIEKILNPKFGYQCQSTCFYFCLAKQFIIIAAAIIGSSLYSRKFFLGKAHISHLKYLLCWQLS